jgi:inhibitor of cysteine peptidase
LKNKVGVLLILLFLILCAFFYFDSTNKIVLTDKDSGRKLDVNKGQLIDLILSENPTTGYSWQLIRKLAPILKEHFPEEYKVNSRLIGAGGKRTFHYLAAEKGNIVLGFVYIRPWEKAAPSGEYKVFITVR